MNKRKFFQRQLNAAFPQINHYRAESVYFSKVNSHLLTMANVFIGNIQREAIKAGTPFVKPTAEALRDYFLGLIEAHLIENSWGYGTTLEDDDYVSRLLDGPKGAVAYSLETFDPGFILKRIECGKKSKRGPSYTPEILIGINHLSKAEIAELRGISTSTVARLRRQLPEFLLNMERAQKAMERAVDAAFAKLRRAHTIRKRNKARAMETKKRARAVEVKKLNKALEEEQRKLTLSTAPIPSRRVQPRIRDAISTFLDGGPLEISTRELVLS